MIQIANKKYYKGKDGIYIGRPSPLGNSFPVKKSKFTDKIYSTEESLILYKRWLWKQIQSENLEVIGELLKIQRTENPILVCWCVNEQGKGRCHGFIIRDYFNWLEKESKRAKELNDYFTSEEFIKMMKESELNMKELKKEIMSD